MKNIFSILFAYLLVWSTLPSNSILRAQEVDQYDQQIELLGKLRDFAEQELSLNIGENAFSEWQKEEGMNLYLYTSEVDSVCKPEGYSNFKSFGTNREKALETQAKLDGDGYQTFLYETAGTSAAKLNKTLVSYRPETIAFIALHEFIHRHLNKTGGKIPYVLEESLCDLFGNEATILFAQTNPKELSVAVANEQKRLNEEIYSALNTATTSLQGQSHDQSTAFAEAQKKMKQLLEQGDAFQNDRFNYPINNAYFLRYTYYAKHYFLLKALLAKTGSLAKTLEFVLSIEKDNANPEVRIRARLAEE